MLFSKEIIGSVCCVCITWLLLFNIEGLHTKSGARAASSGEYFQVNHFKIYRFANFKKNK